MVSQLNSYLKNNRRIDNTYCCQHHYFCLDKPQMEILNSVVEVTNYNDSCYCNYIFWGTFTFFCIFLKLYFYLYLNTN